MRARLPALACEGVCVNGGSGSRRAALFQALLRSHTMEPSDSPVITKEHMLVLTYQRTSKRIFLFDILICERGEAREHQRSASKLSAG